MFAYTVGDADAALRDGDIESAVAIFRNLISDGDTVAMVRLAKMYKRGNTLDGDLESAVALFQRAAQLGDPDAQFSLGNMYLMGEGVAINEESALSLYRLAAQQGHPLAIRNLRELYRANGFEMPRPIGNATSGIGTVDHAKPAISPDEARAMELAKSHGIEIIFSDPRDHE